MSQPDAREPRWAASDLRRLMPDGSLQTPVEAPPTPYADLSLPAQQAGGPAVVTPLPRPRAVPRKDIATGLRLGPVGRVLVGAALVFAVGYMVWGAWLNITG